VFDHTLMVLSNLEEVFEDPLGALSDPVAFEQRCEQRLQRQGLLFTDVAHGPRKNGLPNLVTVRHRLDEIRAYVEPVLDETSRLLLKWTALLHDTGNPATRALNEAGDGPARVQFIGHERLTLQLVDEAVNLWFPPAETSVANERLRDLIARHH